MTSHETRSVLACSVAGGGWLIRFDGGGAEWVDTAACWAAAPEESARVAALGRSLLLSPGEREGILPAEEVRWLLAAPRRLACLIDLIAASEELGQVLSTPLRVTLSDTGEVRWRFAAPRQSACEAVGTISRFRWPMASAA